MRFTRISVVSEISWFSHNSTNSPKPQWICGICGNCMKNVMKTYILTNAITQRNKGWSGDSIKTFPINAIHCTPQLCALYLNCWWFSNTMIFTNSTKPLKILWICGICGKLWNPGFCWHLTFFCPGWHIPWNNQTDTFSILQRLYLMNLRADNIT